MLKALLLVLALQDPKPKTVEDRLKELDDKIAALEKKHQTLADENAALEKKLADGKAWREKSAAQNASFWMKRHASGLSLSEKQSTEIEALWVTWNREAFTKTPDEATWKSREATLREKLTAEQIPLLEKSVRAELESNAKNHLTIYGHFAKIAPERSDAFIKAVLPRVALDGKGLIPYAHGIESSGSYVIVAIQASAEDLAAILTPEERDRLLQLKVQGFRGPGAEK